MSDFNVLKPYLSIVVVSRNDEHGEKMFKRTEVCLNGIITQMERHKLPSELILVEWLPPKNRPLLKDILPWPGGLHYCTTRIIVVPPYKLKSYVYSDDYSIRDLTPWNVGIRRANGQFILSTVTDAILSDDLVEFFAEKTLNPKALYRIDRSDVNREVISIKTFDEQLKYCHNHIIDRHTLSPLKYLTRRGIPVLHDKAPGDFILMSKDHWHQVHGFPQNINCGADVLLIYSAYFSGIRHIVLKPSIKFFHIDHDSRWKSPGYIFFRKIFIKLKLPYIFVDIFSAIGSKIFSTNSDLNKKQIALVSYKEIRKMIIEMKRGKRSFVNNQADWGLGDIVFEDFRPR